MVVKTDPHQRKWQQNLLTENSYLYRMQILEKQNVEREKIINWCGAGLFSDTR